MNTRCFLGFVALGLIGCAAVPQPEDEGEQMSDLALEQVSLPTLRTTLKAGDPYSPFSDERPLTIAGQPACLTDPKTEMTPGATEVEASVIATRRDLMNRLDLGVEGVPVNIAALSGATGTARLAVDTELNERSLTLMFQAKGTYETTLTGLGAQPAAFDSAKVASCGWGYVNKAYHRLSAIVLVTIEASDGTSHVRLGCGQGEKDCTPTSIGAGPTKAKLALETMLKSGHFELHVRSVADVIPGLAPTPLGEIAALSSSPDTAAAVIAKLDSSLDWLGGAQAQIAKRIEDIRKDATLGAPTIKVDFRYWPGMDADLEDRAARTYDRIVDLRKDYDQTLARTATWDAFDDDREAGFGHMYQTPALPVATPDELARREDQARAALDPHRSDLEARFDDCSATARNQSALGDATALVGALEKACRPVTALVWRPEWDVRRFAPVSITQKQYDEYFDNMCPDGQRIPTKDEATLLMPWSYHENVWVKREWIGAKALYVSQGNVERVGLFQAPSYTTVCFDASTPSLFD